MSCPSSTTGPQPIGSGGSAVIAWLTGVVKLKKSQALVLDVRGVGYLVHVGQQVLAKYNVDASIDLYVETIVREDALTLYGFENLQTQDLFNLLHSVQGVGPRLALGILDQLSPGDLARAVQLADVHMFKPVSGVGPKLASRLVGELKDKLPPIFEGDLTQTKATEQVVRTEFQSDVVSALINLGFPEARSRQVVVKISQDHAGEGFEDLLRLALKELSHG